MIFFIYFFLNTFQLVSSDLVNRMDHDLLIANNSSYDLLVKSPRSNTPTATFFYSSKDKDIKSIINYSLDIAAKELKGIYPIYTVNCDENEKVCKAELKDESTPKLVIYPVLPQPQYFFNGNLDDKKDIVNKLISHIPSRVEVIPSDGFQLFTSNMEVVPKVLLVTNKEKPSWIYKALSNSFRKSLIFGFFNSNNHKEVVNKFNIKKFPWLAILKNDKAEVYEGEMKFQPIFDWLNIYSETYIKGADTAEDANVAPKPWKFDKIPQLTFESHYDICFRDTTKGLCVIYLTNKITSAEKSMLSEISDSFSSKIQGRGVSFRWMWLSLQSNQEFKTVFKVTELPSLVVLNPHKRLRYVALEGVADKGKIIELLEKIQTGDARFTTIPGGKLPEFTLHTEL